MHLRSLTGVKHEYALYEGKFIRSISCPDTDCSSEKLAEAISEYIKLFDKLLKCWLSGRLDAHEIEAAYYSGMLASEIHI